MAIDLSVPSKNDAKNFHFNGGQILHPTAPIKAHYSCISEM